MDGVGLCCGRQEATVRTKAEPVIDARPIGRRQRRDLPAGGEVNELDVVEGAGDSQYATVRTEAGLASVELATIAGDFRAGLPRAGLPRAVVGGPAA
jgi:hypothetical protein